MPVDVAHFDRLYPAIVIDTRNIGRIPRSNANLVTEINRDGYITGARVVLYERRMRKRNGHVALNYKSQIQFSVIIPRYARFFPLVSYDRASVFISQINATNTIHENSVEKTTHGLQYASFF
jgi:excinuclease UvrABC ATPase subunit